MPSPTIAWKVCPENAKVQCGTMKVPVDWANPAGPATTLTIARRPATDPAHRIGALLVNPGGPGGSAVDFTFDATGFFGEQVRKQFDIVGMDPRGVGRSSPVLCSQDLVDEKPSPLVETPTQYAALMDYNRRLAADCASRTGPVFAHVDTASVVRDVDAVRVALGEEKISFYGASYGSLIGEQYAESFPARLRALVLDGVMDHSANIGVFLVQETDAAQDSFREFVAWCARDTRCVLRGQNIYQLWAGLMARARAGTLQNPTDPPEKLTPAGLSAAAFAAFYEPQWYSFAYYLKDAAGLKPKVRRPDPVQVDIVDHSFPAVICSDWHMPINGFPDLHRRLTILAGRAPQMLASPLALAATVGCLGWPNFPPNPQHRFVAPPGLPPVLLIGSRHDPATAYAWAQRMTQQFGPAGNLLTYEGWGHVVYNRSPCVAANADKYLISLVRPAAGATCPPVEPQPFGVG
ncbi:peptidase [Paractinoplanes durhamensis]|uniref:Peptidase n=1 Tax=Paractinoplanes durhamensis TaxID=113563 RepID=A0ABQ3Z9C8_9ACTN|nr:peptidase [Actinoplanes durhamensis]